MVIFLKLQIVCFKYLQISQNIFFKNTLETVFYNFEKGFFFGGGGEELNYFFCLNCSCKKIAVFSLLVCLGFAKFISIM